jgi:hypothetical protein
MTPFIFVILFWFGHNCWNSCFQKVIVEFLSTISLVCAGFCVLADPLSMKPSWYLKQPVFLLGLAVHLSHFVCDSHIRKSMTVWPFLLQEEELADGLQLEPPGMHLIYLPYADDIRPTEKAGSQLLTQSEIATD